MSILSIIIQRFMLMSLNCVLLTNITSHLNEAKSSGLLMYSFNPTRYCRNLATTFH